MQFLIVHNINMDFKKNECCFLIIKNICKCSGMYSENIILELKTILFKTACKISIVDCMGKI